MLVLSTPAYYALELTSACDNHCPGCYNVFADQRASAPLPLDAWRKILQHIRPSAYLVKLTGGEPTLHPQFAGIVDCLAEFEISFSLFTNACWANPEQILSILKAAPSLCGLLVSLHGVTAEAHEFYTRRPGSFQMTVDNLRRATGAGIEVTISTVLHRRNLDQCSEIADLAAELGADHVVFNRYLGPRQPAIEPTRPELRRVVAEIESLRGQGARVKFGNCIPQCFAASSSQGCLSGVAYATISPAGDLRPCSHADIRCGNLLKGSVEQAWQSKEMLRWRQLVPEQCQACVELEQCHGGCRAMALEWNLLQDPLVGEPITEVREHPEPLKLHEGLRPVGTYHLREEPFGYVLLRGNCIARVDRGDKALLDACDGQTTLKQLQDRFGAEAVSLAVALVLQGLMEYC